MHPIINYKDRMVYPECDRIIGTPTYDTIRKLEHQLIANSTCATTILGGGNHRYLGLIKTPEQYAIITSNPFIRPPHPGPITSNNGTTAQISSAERSYTESLRLYTKCEKIERVLKQQIMSSIDIQYLCTILNSTT